MRFRWRNHVVIFGAGASYDALDIEINATEKGRSDIEACRLPLTNDSTDSARKQGIKSNNYCHLLGALSRNCREDATLITFNYDMFLEDAMHAILDYDYPDISSYYRGRPFSVFKLHGSVNWGYTGVLLPVTINTSRQLIEYIVGNQHVRERYDAMLPHLIKDYKIDNSYFLPAIHIPLPQQKDSLIKEQEALVIQALEATDKLIIIGWSARDEYMVKLIKEKVCASNTSVMVVSGSGSKNESDADLILETITNDQNVWKHRQLKTTDFPA